MKNPTVRSMFLILSGILSLSVLISGCGLSSEPEIISTRAVAPAAPTRPPDVGRPQARTDLASAAQSFVENCQPCHGAAGLGDGPVAASFTCAMPNLTDPAISREKSPAEWFTVISNGNGGTAECLMPPWRTRLNESQRWEVGAYAFALQYTAESLQRGAEVWGGTCAACHGSAGAGNGEKAASLGRPLPNFSAPDALFDKSDTILWRQVSSGIEGVDGHAFEADLPEADRWAVVAYMRTLGWDGAELLGGKSVAAAATASVRPLEPAATEEATTEATLGAASASTPAPTSAAVSSTPAPITPTTVAVAPALTKITVKGKLSAGSAGMTLPTTQKVTLRVIEHAGENLSDVVTLETTTDAEGNYSFADVPRREGLIYTMLTDYGGITQYGEPTPISAEAGDTLEVPLALFETTADPAVLQVEIARIFIDFTDTNQALVQAAMRYRNIGDRIYLSPEKTSDGQPVGFVLPIPSAASQLTLSPDLGDQFVIRQGSPAAIQGLLPIQPRGSGVVQFQYLITFNGDLTLNMPNPYAMVSLTVNTPQDGRTLLRDPRFDTEAPLTLDTGVYDTYTLNQTIPAGGNLNLLIVRTPESDARATVALVIFLAALAFGATALAVVAFTRRGSKEISEEDPRTAQLIEAIATLDDLHAAGKMAQKEYDQRRATLKAGLTALLNPQEPTPKKPEKRKKKR
ncbi:hypothetical protein ANRL4_03489 [Anaerolineae bacterium]|nr:hypothetical protein ANRL4_03489 [Anaerolineae bacterium]